MSAGTQLLFRDDAYQKSTTATVIAVEDNKVQLDRTLFYPTGGGQPGDRGTLTGADGQVYAVIDTRKGDVPDSILHVLAEGAAVPAVGTALTGAIVWDYRHRLMRLHTCLHLLCAVVPGSVTGGQISDGKARLDFDVPGDSLDKEEITTKLNGLIAAGHAVETRWITDEELAAKPELVRTMSVKPPTGAGRIRLLDIVGVDLQPCGGTHIRNTAEIGPITVTKIENKGRQNRRINIAFAG
jgi:misacylated tRNA(Ala) deacylase